MREDIKIKARPEDEVINAVIEREWSMFDKVQNIGGCRASCQNDEWTFYANRYSQFSALSQETVFSYYNDLTRAIEDGRNVITEKYAYMMEFTDPEYYHRELEASLPAVPAENMELVQQIVEIQLRQVKAQNALDLTMNTRRITISEQASVYGCPMIFTGASALRYKKSMTDFLKHIWA